jgi:hypothetical protein
MERSSFQGGYLKTALSAADGADYGAIEPGV